MRLSLYILIINLLKQFAEDEEPSRYRKDKMASLRPAFSKTGTITAANASKLNDGASCISNERDLNKSKISSIFLYFALLSRIEVYPLHFPEFYL